MRIARKESLEDIEKRIWEEARVELDEEVNSNLIQFTTGLNYNVFLYQKAYRKLREHIIKENLI